jgi:AcrR family transcriptional regulator
MVQNSEKRPRGRPRGYDPDDALARATAQFWRGGFAGTSLDELSAATGMNRPSLYGAFGDKRELYLATLDRYLALSLAAMEAALDPAQPLAAGLQAVYDRSLALYFADADSPLGCFLVGTAATEAARDSAVREKLGAALRALTRAFEARLRRARDDGELGAGADPALLANLAAAALYAIALRARAGDSRGSLRRFAQGTVQLLCGGAAAKRTARRKRSP